MYLRYGKNHAVYKRFKIQSLCDLNFETVLVNSFWFAWDLHGEKREQEAPQNIWKRWMLCY